MEVGSSHGKRWVTAAIALPVLVLVMLGGGKAGFACLVSLISALALLEYYGLLLPEETTLAKGIGVVCCLFIMAGFYFGREKSALAMLICAFLVMSFLYLYRESPAHFIVERLSKQILGFVYIPVFFGHLIWIRNGQDGLMWTVMLLGIVFAADTGAYYAGKNLGKRKLCPRISPGKTIEGSIGGLIAAVGVASVIKYVSFPQLLWPACIVLALVTGAVAQMGDLAESVLKRSVDVKDAGRLLPGHGGVLDRIDGLLFAIPVFYYLKEFVI